MVGKCFYGRESLAAKSGILLPSVFSEVALPPRHFSSPPSQHPISVALSNSIIDLMNMIEMHSERSLASEKAEVEAIFLPCVEATSNRRAAVQEDWKETPVGVGFGNRAE